MQTAQRRSELTELIKKSGFARLNDLAKTIQVSESTVRRDLILLEKEGVVRRTHGGVVYCSSKPHFVPAFPTTVTSQQKMDIALLAASLVDDGDTILLDGGSTTLELARQIQNRQIQVVTNSIPVAEIFCEDEHVDLVLLGGFVHSRSQLALGPFTVSMLQQLHCRRAFLSAAGINEHGLFNSNLLLVETERAMIACADTLTVLADSSKFGRSSTVNLCPLKDVDEMIVDSAILPEWKQKIESASIRLSVAENKTQMETELS